MPFASAVSLSPSSRRRNTARLALVLSAVVASSAAHAQQATTVPLGNGQTGTVLTTGNFWQRYQARVSATQAEQPHWITPLVTVTPRLEQELRTDFTHETLNTTKGLWNYGNSKGLEFIPERHIEILVNVPPFFNRSNGASDGFGDMSFNSKYRFFARNEEHGNAIITGFFAATIPTGKNGNGSCCATVTPTLAVGKGFGQLALTSTAGGTLPISNTKGLGRSVAWNNTVQYRAAKSGAGRLFWPEVEFNSTFFKGGANDGKTQTFATPGLVIGRVPLTHDASGKPGRLGLTFGAGEQIALTHFHTYSHSTVLTLRMPF
jgi:hypothetical protein